MVEDSESFTEPEPPDKDSESKRLEDLRQRARRQLAARLGIMRELANGHNPPKKPRRKK